MPCILIHVWRLNPFGSDLTIDKLPSPINDVLSRKVEADMIGTPDPISNLRPVRYFVPADESPEVDIFTRSTNLHSRHDDRLELMF